MNSLSRVQTGTAYILWCISLFGICGIQRFYVGQVGMGILYLLTFGFCGIGQLIDLLLIPGMIERRNAELLGRATAGTLTATPHLAVPKTPPESDLKRLLVAAKKHKGVLSPARAAMELDMPPERINELLTEAVRFGYADITNDLETGAVRYEFDL